jgi:hypothetical protein
VPPRRQEQQLESPKEEEEEEEEEAVVVVAALGACKAKQPWMLGDDAVLSIHAQNHLPACKHNAGLPMACKVAGNAHIFLCVLCCWLLSLLRVRVVFPVPWSMVMALGLVLDWFATCIHPSHMLVVGL